MDFLVCFSPPRSRTWLTWLDDEAEAVAWAEKFKNDIVMHVEVKEV